MTEDNTKQGFKVADKRRFDSDGNETEPVESAKSQTASKNDGASGTKPANSAEQSAPGRELDFNSFVMSLATQAVVQLGEMPARGTNTSTVRMLHVEPGTELGEVAQLDEQVDAGYRRVDNMSI